MSSLTSRCYFVTGTNTDVGKTILSCALITAFKKKGFQTIGLKPLATGCEKTPEGLRSADALALQHVNSHFLPYDKINPFCFEPPTAVHLAAQSANTTITVQQLKTHLDPIFAENFDVILIEGIGGWIVPLNETETLADFLKTISCEIILVVDIKLGSLNHALLTAQAIQQSGFFLAGWIANCKTPEFSFQSAYVDSLKNWIKAPLLGVIAYQESLENIVETTADQLTLEPLLRT